MLDEITQKVHEAALTWRIVPIRERLRVLRAAGEILRKNRIALLDCLRADGLSTVLAEFYGAWIERQASAELLEYTAGELLRTTPSDHEMLVRRPDGVVALITPANSPTINTAPLFSMLLVGNGVIMRAPGHDGGVRLIATHCIGAALDRAGYSADLVRVVTSPTRPLLEAIYASSRIDTIVFFGNAVAGHSVAVRGHEAGKKVVLELEGSDCMAVWSDADVPAALASASRGYDFSTQPCPIPKHFLVHPAVEAEFVAGLVERARCLRTVEVDREQGMLVPLARPERFDQLASEARRCGALALGGYRMDASGEAAESGSYGAPTVVVIDHHPELLTSPLFCEEINVPVLPVVRYAGTDDEILAAMISTIAGVPFGLRASLWTTNAEIATRFVRSVGAVGLLVVNGDHAQHPSFLSPWGGPKRSGGPHGESHLFWQKTSRLQGVVGSPAIVRAALLGSADKLRVEIVDEVAWLTLDRPERHNAVDLGLAEQLSDALDSIVDEFTDPAGPNQSLCAVVLRGAGPSFCSGADLTMLRRLDPRAARRFMQDVTWSLRQLERLPVPTLALVHGFCVGGGFEFALHCDAIVAGESAQFGLPEVTHGLTPTAGAVGRLVRAIGKSRATDWLLSGERVDAATANAAGLLTRLVPDDQLDAEALRWLARARSQPRSGVAATKRLLASLTTPDTWLGELEAFETILRGRSHGHG